MKTAPVHMGTGAGFSLTWPSRAVGGVVYQMLDAMHQLASLRTRSRRT